MGENWVKNALVALTFSAETVSLSGGIAAEKNWEEEDCGVTGESGKGAGTVRAIALAIALSISALLFGLGAARDSSHPDRDAASNSHAATFKDGRLLVGFHEWATRAQRRAAEARAGVKEIRT